MNKANDEPPTRDKVPDVTIAAILGYFSRSIDDCVVCNHCAVYCHVRSLMLLRIYGEFANMI